MSQNQRTRCSKRTPILPVYPRHKAAKAFLRQNRLQPYIPRARRRYTHAMITYLHRCTLHNYHQILASKDWTCMYCGAHGSPGDGQEPGIQDTEDPRGATATCPVCMVDALVGSATGFQVRSPYLIALCCRTWFRTYGYIEDREPGTLTFRTVYVD